LLAEAARRESINAGARVLELCAGPALAGLTAVRGFGAGERVER
jgi:predicted nicotinamide N-methyase